LNGLVERLLAAPAGVNPAVEMSRRIREMAAEGELNQERLKELLPEIERAADTGERDLDAARVVARDLQEASAIPSKEVPFGF
jgi:hypothetical protein